MFVETAQTSDDCIMHEYRVLSNVAIHFFFFFQKSYLKCAIVTTKQGRSVVAIIVRTRPSRLNFGKGSSILMLFPIGFSGAQCR